MEITFDIETTGLQYKSDKVTSLAYSMYQEGESAFFYYTSENYDLPSLFQQVIKDWPDAIYIGHNIKFDLRFLEIHPDIVDTLHIIDTTILYHFHFHRESKALGNIEKHIFDTNEKESYLLRNGKNFSNWPKDELREYNLSDVRLTKSVYKYLQSTTDKKFLDFQERYLKALYRMEYNGISFDSEKAEEMIADLSDRIILEDGEIRLMLWKCYGINANEINFNSSKQLSKLLYDDLGINRPERNDFPRGKAFDKLFTATLTNADLLERLDHPFISDFLKLKKLVSFAKSIQTYKDTCVDTCVDNRLYPSFNITGTVTGRLSCSNPNLQNIPKKKDGIANVRSLFKPNKGEKLFSIDYQQQEIRMLAVLSQDQNLLELCMQGTDMHTIVGKKMFKVDELSKEKRDIVKNIHFGMLYGLSSSAIAFNIGQDIEYTDQLIFDYYNTFPDVERWMAETRYEAKIMGKITLFTGRVWTTLENADYQAVNAMIQGSCAELTGMSVIRVNNYYKRTGYGSLISIIHDELLHSVNNVECLTEVKSIMEMEKLFGVPFTVDIEESY